MEITDERLKEVLAAGNIPVTPEALTSLSEWVAKMGSAAARTFLFAEGIRAGKSRTDLKKELSDLCKALQSTVDILNRDRDDGQLAAYLFNKVFGDQVPSVSVSLYSAHTGPGLIKQQCELLIMAQAALKRLQAVKVRRGAPERENTWFLHLVRILYGKLTGTRDPAIAGPLHQFTESFAELIDAAGVVPEDFNTFRGRFR